MYSPIIFSCYQNLAKAILKDYAKELNNCEKVIMREKIKLSKRLANPTGIDEFYKKRSVVRAWQIWERYFAEYEWLQDFKKTDLYDFYVTLAQSPINSNYKTKMRY